RALPAPSRRGLRRCCGERCLHRRSRQLPVPSSRQASRICLPFPGFPPSDPPPGVPPSATVFRHTSHSFPFQTLDAKQGNFNRSQPLQPTPFAPSERLVELHHAGG